MFSKVEIVRYLDGCKNDEVAISEVLSAYVVSKYLKGSNSQMVLAKLRMLVEHLKASGRTDILTVADESFRTIAFEVSIGGGHIGSSPAMTDIGKCAWNELRRHTQYSPSVLRRSSGDSSASSGPSSRASSIHSTSSYSSTKKAIISTDEEYGGPGAVAFFLSEEQKSGGESFIGSTYGIGLPKRVNPTQQNPLPAASQPDILEHPVRYRRATLTLPSGINSEAEGRAVENRLRLAGLHFRTRPHLVAVLPEYESGAPEYSRDEEALPLYETEEGVVERCEGERVFEGMTVRPQMVLA